MKTPWKVTEVSIDSESHQVRVECARGVPWADPKIRERAPIKDWQDRTMRHPDTFGYETVISASVPRIILSDGRTMMVSHQLDIHTPLVPTAPNQLSKAGMEGFNVFIHVHPIA